MSYIREIFFLNQINDLKTKFLNTEMVFLD